MLAEAASTLLKSEISLHHKMHYMCWESKEERERETERSEMLILNKRNWKIRPKKTDT